VSVRLFIAAVAAGTVWVTSLAGTALGAPPANDNYLQAVRINQPGTAVPSGQQQFRHITDTTEATTQTDLFSPQGSGGGAENTVCNGQAFGKTVWYVFFPHTFGTAHFLTAGGLDAVVAVYQFDPATSRLTRLVGCGNDPGLSDEVFLNGLQRGSAYAVQLGGLNTGGGPESGRLQLTFEFFADSDQDGTFDALDRCPTLPGSGGGGCPRDLDSTVRLTAQPTGSGIIVRSLTVRAVRGAQASLRCRRGCRIRQGRTTRTVSFSRLRGRFLRAGASIEIRVTRAGYFGDYIRFDIRRGSFRRIDRCLRPGSSTPRSRCP
jgi:hypothetical protein